MKKRQRKKNAKKIRQILDKFFERQNLDKVFQELSDKYDREFNEDLTTIWKVSNE